MGDAANDMLRLHIRGQKVGAYRDNPRLFKAHDCDICGWSMRGESGVMQHQNAVHGNSWTKDDLAQAQKRDQAAVAARLAEISR